MRVTRSSDTEVLDTERVSHRVRQRREAIKEPLACTRPTYLTFEHLRSRLHTPATQDSDSLT